MQQLFHASTVSIDGRGVMICGGSGTGKSALALRLMALGAILVADDQTLVETRHGDLWARAPEPLRGMIEARGVGLLNAPFQDEARLCLCIDLDEAETDRLPPCRERQLGGVNLPLVLGQRTDHFPSAVLLFARHGRRE